MQHGNCFAVRLCSMEIALQYGFAAWKLLCSTALQHGNCFAVRTKLLCSTDVAMQRPYCKFLMQSRLSELSNSENLDSCPKNHNL